MQVQEVSTKKKLGLRDLFRASLLQDLKKKLRKILCESVFYPGDGFWLSEQLADFFEEANRAAGVQGTAQAVQVDGEESSVSIRNSETSVLLEWRVFWQEKEKGDRRLASLVELLLGWSAYNKLANDAS